MINPPYDLQDDWLPEDEEFGSYSEDYDYYDNYEYLPEDY